MSARRAAAILVLVLVGRVATPARADDAAVLAEANVAARAADWEAVDAAIAPLVPRAERLAAPDRAELARLRGLVAFFGQRHADAEAHFLLYLRLDLDARLDPTAVPPEAIGFFEDVRARHGAELRARRPRPKRWWPLNLLPPAGQLQNGERGKAVALGVGLAVLLSAHFGTYALVRTWCRSDDRTCDGHSDSARVARTVNLGSGVAALVVYAIGVVDGFRGARRAEIIANATAGGAMVGARLEF